MEIHKAKALLQGRYPDAPVTIVSPQEVIAELGGGRAVAAIGAGGSDAHFHRETTESYKILDGELAVIVAGEVEVLGPGDACVIPICVVHKAQSLRGPWSIVEVTSEPEWSKADHFLV